MTAPHILVVCTANICRSPVAEALLQDKLHAAGLASWTVTSAGTWAVEGNAASRFSVLLMEEQGLDIQAHRSQPVTDQRMAQTDLVLCMETEHVRTLQRDYPSHQHKIYTLRQMVEKRGSVRDPYGGSRRQYERMVAEVDELIEQGLPRIRALAQENFQKRGRDG
ncbi:MAG: low molecular weight protein arginine phosphatase [Ardenticatenaceae bacterium]|nr:low molecular weight protein arginine phosphatase [Ardenticatenaceae bacterium]MCB8947183.1 low molecular weight protein arginine phosphatase [Ardenticatenaceae bacterium]